MCLLSGLDTNPLHIFLFNHACQLLVLLGRASACFVFTLPLFPPRRSAGRSFLALLKHRPFMYSLSQIFAAITQIDGRTLALVSSFFLYQLSVMWGTSNRLLTDMSASRSFSRVVLFSPLRPTCHRGHTLLLSVERGRMN